MKKRIVFILLLVSLLFGLLAISAFAETLPENIHTISTVDELLELAELVNQGNEGAANASYLLTSNIYFNDAVIPIGTLDHPFRGSFDGNGKRISGLTAAKGDSYFGLFGVTKDAQLSRIAIDKASVYADGYNGVGAIVGYMQGGILSESYVTGTVNSSTAIVGGLVGVLDGGTVENCYNTAEVNGCDTAGGVVGCAMNGAVINCCYGSGWTNTAVWKKQVGYVVGTAENASVANSYAINGTDYYGYIIRDDAAYYESSYTGFDFVSVWTLNGSAPMLKNNAYNSRKSIMQNTAVSSGAKYRALLIGQQSYGGEQTRPGRATAGYMQTALENSNDNWAITNQCDVSKSGVESLISSTFGAADSDDINLFFFCGHGHPDENLSSTNTGYLECYNGSYITTSQLAYWLNSVSGHFYVIIDSCGSGAVIAANSVPNSSANNFNEDLISAFDELDRRTIVANSSEMRTSKFSVLTACDYNENSWTTFFDNSDYTKGVFNFTKYLLDAAGFPISKGDSDFVQRITETMPGDINGDKRLTFQEAYTYTYNESIEWLSNKSHVQMYPSNCIDVLFNRANTPTTYAVSLNELKGIDYLAFSDIAYSSLTEGKTVGETIGSKMFQKWKDTDFLYYDIFNRIADWKIDKISQNTDTGFYAAAFRNDRNEVVISYRGSTTDVFTEDGIYDWLVNDIAAQAYNYATDQSQIPDAMSFYNSLKNTAADICVTGHSLGGGLGDVVSAITGCKGQTFNALSLIDVAFTYFPELAAAGFHGVNTWNFMDHANEYDLIAGQWGDSYKPHYDHESNYIWGRIKNHSLDSFVVGNKDKDGNIISVELSDIINTTTINSVLEWPLNNFLNRFGSKSYVVLGTSGEDGVGYWGESSKYVVFGGDGNDVIQTGSADDIICGGKGIDTLDGEFGSDTFIFCYGDGPDVIGDFSAYPNVSFPVSGVCADEISLIGFPQNSSFEIKYYKERASILCDGNEIIRIIRRDDLYHVTSNTGWEALIDFPDNPGESEEALSAITFSSASAFSVSLPKNWDGKLYSSTDAAVWNEWDGTRISALKNTADGKYYLYLRGEGNSVISYKPNYSTGFTISGSKVACTGNIETLLDYKTVAAGKHPTMSRYCFYELFYGCTSLTSAPELPATTLANGCYEGMFWYCTSLTSAPALPATTLADHCYKCMFFYCTSLTSAPALPATTLADGCYEYMFEYCTSLANAPALPATTLANGCYHCMFPHCTSMTSAPALPATTLANGCYSYMFSACTSLMSAPALPATTLADHCYENMFSGCTSLTNAPALPATTLAYGCYSDMFYGCTSLTNAPELPATTLVDYCYAGMFGECTSLKNAPELPATTLADYCYYRMFDGCTGLTSAPALPATTLAEDCYKGMFLDCTSLTSAPALPAITLADYCYSSMFYGCTSLTSAPALPATTLADGCYHFMFSGCTNLTSAPALPATTLAYYCYEYMFSGCTGLTSAPALPATTLADGCYHSMFMDCTSLTSAPALPATTLAYGCYDSMFCGCTSLTSAPALPATTLASWCYRGMFYGCTSLMSAPELPATTLADYCYKDMFHGCTSLTSAPALKATMLADDCYDGMFYGCTSLMSIEISESVTRIDENAFYDCRSLSDVYFYGTEAQWASINIGEGNDCLTVATIHYLITGQCGDNLTWTLDDAGTLTISGTGAMTAFQYNSQPWADHLNEIQKVVVDSGVTGIGDCAFMHCPNLKAAILPDGLMQIGLDAFCSCTALENITIPESVWLINNYAFSECTGLKTIELSKNISLIGAWAFANCDNLTAINVNEENTDYKSVNGILFAIGGAGTGLEAVPAGISGVFEVPAEVTMLQLGAFSGCKKLTAITVPSGVTSLGLLTFDGCRSLESVSIPESVNEIQLAAFQNCTALKDIYYSGSFLQWTQVRIESFNDAISKAQIHFGKENITGECGDDLTWTLTNDGVLTISGTGNMYDYSTRFEPSYLGGTVSTAPWFDLANVITSVTIDEGVTGIGNYAFYGATQIETISISSTVARIGENVFDCQPIQVQMGYESGNYVWMHQSNLTAINVADGNASFKSVDGVLFNEVGTELIRYPGGRSGSYEIPSGVTSIRDYAFFGCTNLMGINIPDSVLSIGESAFSYCSNLTEVYYTGSEDQWKEIQIGQYNECLTGTNIHYNHAEQESIEDFAVTVPTAMSDKVTITAPEGGWVIGENTFSASADKACVLAVSYDGGQTYTRLKATANGDGTYSFDVNITDENTIIACAYKGDANGDNEITSGDINKIKGASLGKTNLSSLAALTADVNGDNDLTSGDINKLKAAMLGKTNIDW